MSGYRMSYVMPCPGPPKPKELLTEQEGLTDCLLVVSILGTPGGPGPLSLMPVQLGPNGAEEITCATALSVASALLARFDGRHPAATAGIQAIRRVILSDRS